MWINRFTTNLTSLFFQFTDGQLTPIQDVDFMKETFNTRHFSNENGWNFVELPYSSIGGDIKYT